MAEGPVPQPDIDSFVRGVVQQYRAKLLDLSSRNPLINFRHSDRSRSHIRIIDEIPEIVFEKLISGKQLTLSSLPDPELEPADELSASLQAAFRRARATDEKYKSGLAELGPNASDRQRNKVERELRNRVRTQLALAPFEPTWDAKKRAAELEIPSDYDLATPNGRNARRHTDSNLQTLLFREDLDHKLAALRDSARVLEQDAGLNALYCAFGFVEYYESESSDERRVAPLVFLPIELDRELVGQQYRYFVKSRNEEVTINVALRELLKRELGLQLPAWPEAEEDTDHLSQYLETVTKAIEGRRDWKVHRYVTVGLFTFSTLAMYNDLDPARWPAPNGIESRVILRTLIAGAEVHGTGFAEDYDIDKLQGPEPFLITDADSSQHSAVIDVLKGKSIVVQGPPGTGKSQTITNMIAAAVNAGKSVLFVAEKMAALEVVKKRLDAAGLEHFCLELHSNKTARSAVVDSLARRLEYRGVRVQATTVESNADALRRAKDTLLYYVEKTNEAAGRTGLSVSEILLGSAIREQSRGDFPETLGNARFANALTLTPHILSDMRAAAAVVQQQLGPLAQFGRLQNHPWRGLQNTEITEFESNALINGISRWQASLEGLVLLTTEIFESTATWSPESITGQERIAHEVRRLPNPAADILKEMFSACSDASARDRLSKFVSAVESLTQLECSLKSLTDDPASAVQLGSQAIVRSVSTLRQLGLRDASIVTAREAAVRWSERLRDVDTSKELTAEIAQACGLPDLSLDSIRCAVSGFEMIRRLPRPLWSFRSPEVLDAENQDFLSRAAGRLSELRSRRDALANEFDLAFLPSPNDLSAMGRALRSANFLTARFSKACRDARRMFRSISSNAAKTNRLTMAIRLLQCAQYALDLDALEKDSKLQRVCGDLFAGIETPLSSLAEVSAWAAQTRVRLCQLGRASVAVRELLFTATSDELEKLLSFEEHGQFAALLRTLQFHGDDRTSTWDNISNWAADRLNALNSALNDFGRAAVHEECGPLELDALSQAVKGIESHVRSLETDQATLALVGGDLLGARRSASAILSTLEYAMSIAQSGLPSQIINFLFADLEHVSWLKLQCDSLVERVTQCRVAAAQVLDLAKLDSELWCGCGKIEDADAKHLARRCRYAAENGPVLQDYMNFLLAEDSAIEAGIGPVLNAYVTDKQDYHHLVEATDFVFYKSAAQQIVDADPRLRKHSGATHQQLREQYQELDREFLQLRRRQLASTLLERLPPEGNYVGRVADLTELGLVRHLAGQTRPRVPLRELLRRAGQSIKELKPCWMMSPMSVAQFLEPAGLTFDLVIMDEASQIRPEEALGAIARAKQVVIVGDQMQLPPTSFFQKLSTDGLEDSDDADFDEVKQESVLEAAASRFFPPRRLKWHYRSEHGSLISFSNREFYDDELTVFPSPHHDHPEYGVKLVEANGIYGAGLNPDEGRTVVRAAAEFMKAFPKQSLGIVAVNAKQADFIREELDRLFTVDEFAAAYVSRWEPTLDSLFVKNLENVQGDERDVIFISTVYGKDSAGNFHQRFGPINSVYGHRRLNVLFTRAKKRVVVFTSMRPEDIQEENRHKGVRALKLYLQHARDGIAALPVASRAECDSEFERWVLDVLKNRGYDAVPQLGFSGYRIDIAVRNPSSPGTFLCAIECDGASYHSARSARERDRLRQEVLERYGWKIYRIWSTDWFRNPSLQTKNLLQYLQRLQDI